MVLCCIKSSGPFKIDAPVPEGLGPSHMTHNDSNDPALDVYLPCSGGAGQPLFWREGAVFLTVTSERIQMSIHGAGSRTAKQIISFLVSRDLSW